MRLFITGVLLLLIQTSNLKSIESEYADPVIITGRVLNVDKFTDSRTIQFYHHDIITGEQIPTTAIINPDGSFLLSLALPFKQDLFLSYAKKAASLFCSPGDIIFMEIDAEDAFAKENNVEFPLIKIQFQGPTKKTNEEINKYYLQIQSGQYTFRNEMEAIRTKKPDEYKAHIFQRESTQLQLLEEFNTENNTTDDFRNWARKHIKYSTLDDLMRYRWLHPDYNGINKIDFKVPDSYFDFLNDYQESDLDSYLMIQANFIKEIKSYAITRSLDSFNKQLRVLADEGIAPAFKIQMNAQKEISKGADQKILMTRFYLSLLNEVKDLKVFNALYDESLIDHPYLKDAIAKQLNIAESGKSAQQAPKEVVKPAANTTPKGLNEVDKNIVTSLLSKYKGKVVYIDFWAPWCGPCLEEMPYSKKIQEHFKDKDVVFLYIAAQTTEKAWLETREKYSIEGEHVLLTNDQYNIIASTFGFTGIPHYALIDKNGAISSKNATRPKFKDELISKIQTLLK